MGVATRAHFGPAAAPYRLGHARTPTGTMAVTTRAAGACGFLNVRKPAGVTSHHCVRVVRKLFNTRQVGHGGTLDPMATGVLTVALGKATRFLQYLTTDKEYRGVVRFGVTTDSDDITGEVLTKRAAPWLSEALVASTLQSFVGAIDQVPPRVSAIKKDGVRLYELARANKAIDLSPRRVHIADIDIQQFTPGDFPEASIHVVCGAGTYIRSIARECGEKLLIPPELVDNTCELRNAAGDFCVGGTLTALERTRSGSFTSAESLDVDEIRGELEKRKSLLKPIESVLPHLAFAVLPQNSAHRWQIGGIVVITSADVTRETNGHSESMGHATLADGETIRIYSTASSELLGVSQLEKQGRRDRFILRKRIFI